MDVPKGCEAKLLRAAELIGSLEIETAAVLGSRDFLRPFIGGTRGVGYGFHVVKQPPWERWSAIVGEVVHDLRSALDQLTWAASVEHSGPVPEPGTRVWREVAFPICRRREELYAAGGSLNLSGPGRGLRLVNPATIPLFDRLQPFHARRPERHRLAVLGGLWNLDKHRAQPLVAAMSQRGAVVTEGPGMSGRSRPKIVPAPLPDHVLLAAVSRMTGTSGDLKEGDQVDIKFLMKLDARVAFAPGPPAFGGDLLAKLRGLLSMTEQAIEGICRPRLF